MSISTRTLSKQALDTLNASHIFPTGEPFSDLSVLRDLAACCPCKRGGFNNGGNLVYERHQGTAAQVAFKVEVCP